MQYAFQLLPHPNVRYQSALEKLGKAELQCMLLALDVFTESTSGKHWWYPLPDF